MAENTIPLAAWPSIVNGHNNTKLGAPTKIALLELTEGARDPDNQLIVSETIQNADIFTMTSDSIVIVEKTYREIKHHQIVGLSGFQLR